MIFELHISIWGIDEVLETAHTWGFYAVLRTAHTFGFDDVVRISHACVLMRVLKLSVTEIVHIWGLDEVC